MSTESNIQDGVNILPIPPPLEFPYPRQSPDSSVAPSVAKVHRTSEPQTRPIKETNAVKHASTAPLATGRGYQDPQPAARPSVSRNKYVTERPAATQRGSLLGIRRSPTNNITSELNTGAWGSETSSSSSSSEDEEPNEGRKKRSRVHTWDNRRSQICNRQDPQNRRKASADPYSRISVGNDDYKTKGRVSKRDGRLNISLKETGNRGYLAKALGATLQHVKPGAGKDQGESDTLSPLHEEDAGIGLTRTNTASTASTSESAYDRFPIPTLNIVIMVIGSRGDIQPFLRLGKILKEDHGHRVRIATHPAFKKFVEQDSGLEFFSVGGDPAEIMAFMVKNPGLIPKTETIRSGEIGRRRESMYSMFQGFWRACINVADDERDPANRKMMGDKHPFVADVIIANPPSIAHVHCAERLGIPLHLVFTFPNSPTQQFPHPLTNIKQTNVDANYTNFISYPLVETMIWQGLGDLVNNFRVKTLGLEPLSTLWAPGQLFRLKVPYTYLWSPGLIPKPADWGPEINVTGFVFLDLASSFKPPEALTKFLEAGDPPVYIGFGSIVVDDPDKFTSLIFEAVKKAGVRALVSKGWGGLGGEDNTPDNIFMLDNTPHDWLFPRVRAVVHHGGAGTTAIGLKCGKPTLIVPFFGDQPFWGAMAAKAGASAEPIPYKRLTVDKLAEGIEELLTPEAQKNAQEIAKRIEDEGDGAINAVKSIHRSLPMRGDHSMRCSILEDRVAVWELKKTHVRLSALAAQILVQKKAIKWHNLKLLRHYEWNDFEGPGEPFTGAGAALANSFGKAVQGVGRTPFRWAKAVKRHEHHEEKKRKLEQRKSLEAARKSQEKEHKPLTNGNSKPTQEKSAISDLDGEHGAEKHLPSGPLMGACAEDQAARDGSGPTLNEHRVDGDNESVISDLTDNAPDNVVQSIAAETGAGLAKTGGALMKAPMDISVAIAQGFHNAPRLYGDKTVRRPTRITGIKSGLKAAGEEFGYGIYDGWTGLVKHPYHGAKEGGALGFAKGMGKGVGGWVLKDLAAPFGLFGYTLKGIQKQLTRGRQPTAFIEHARVKQGEKDIRELSAEERAEATEQVKEAWQIIAEIRKEKENLKDQGIRGRMEVYQTERRWERHGVFENVEQTGRALEAEREGEDFEEVFEAHRRSLRRARRPRRSPLTDGEGKGGGKSKSGSRMGKKDKENGKSKESAGGKNGRQAASASKEVKSQPNGTVLAGGHTGTDIQDLATAPGRPAAEALVNPIAAKSHPNRASPGAKGAAAAAKETNALAELDANAASATPSVSAAAGTISPARKSSEAWPPRIWVPVEGSAVDGAPLEEGVRVWGDADTSVKNGPVGKANVNGGPKMPERSVSAVV
ncbi:hypothetical protein MMC30_008848 [Trapelia coarctata]|nr:hypothetical protein [Trapelia coarctata]